MWWHRIRNLFKRQSSIVLTPEEKREFLSAFEHAHEQLISEFHKFERYMTAEEIKNAIKNETNKKLLQVVAGFCFLSGFKAKITEGRLNDLDEWERNRLRIMLAKYHDPDNHDKIVLFPRG